MRFVHFAAFGTKRPLCGNQGFARPRIARRPDKVTCPRCRQFLAK